MSVERPHTPFRDDGPGMYGDDLAHVHHAGFTGYVRGAAPAILAAAQSAGIHRGRAVDLGCGSGVWLRQASVAGFEALGIDRSESMLRLARAAAPEAQLRVGSIYETDLPECSVVTAVGEVLSYVDPDTGEAAPTNLFFQRVFNVLTSPRLFMFDLFVASAGAPMGYRNWYAADDWTILVEATEDVARARLHRDQITFREIDGTFRRSHERHVLRVAEPAEIAAQLRDAGFSVEASTAYGNFELPPRRMAFTAIKDGRAAAREPSFSDTSDLPENPD